MSEPKSVLKNETKDRATAERDTLNSCRLAAMHRRFESICIPSHVGSVPTVFSKIFETNEQLMMIIAFRISVSTAREGFGAYDCTPLILMGAAVLAGPQPFQLLLPASGSYELDRFKDKTKYLRLRYFLLKSALFRKYTTGSCLFNVHRSALLHGFCRLLPNGWPLRLSTEPKIFF